MKGVVFAGGGTGGHLYPALALADAIRAARPQTDVWFVGAQRGVEARVLPAENRPHTLLPFEPLRRSQVWQNWRLVPSLVKSFVGLRRVFQREQPRLVVGTGGYASAPACLLAVASGIPVAIQEQNSYPGLTTRMMSRWARQVHLGFPEAAKLLKPGKHTEITTLGNPIRPPDPSLVREECRAKFGLQPDSMVLLVVGGSQGARAINQALTAALAQYKGVPAGVEILWATGPANHASVTSALAAALSPSESLGIHALPYISNMPEALCAADVAISRAGAMGTAELLAWGIPSILIPLPTAAADHQTHNARALGDAGAAKVLIERELTPELLWNTVLQLVEDADTRERMANAAKERARPLAASQIASRLIELIES